MTWSSISARLARDPLIFSLSLTIEGVISLYCGTSFNSFSYVGLSKSTWLFNLSRTFPLDHFCKNTRKYVKTMSQHLIIKKRVVIQISSDSLNQFLLPLLIKVKSGHQMRFKIIHCKHLKQRDNTNLLFSLSPRSTLLLFLGFLRLFRGTLCILFRRL